MYKQKSKSKKNWNFNYKIKEKKKIDKEIFLQKKKKTTNNIHFNFKLIYKSISHFLKNTEKKKKENQMHLFILLSQNFQM